MKKLIFVLLILPIFAFSQEENKIVYDENAGEDIILGVFTQQGLTKEPFSEWYTLEYDNYSVDEKILKDLDLDKFQNSVINIIMGTWCGDSQREIPRFYKILEYLKFDKHNIKSIAVNRIKEVPGMQISRLGIEKVPTFIFYLDNIEIGRIIESPEISLEKDIVKIYSNK